MEDIQRKRAHILPETFDVADYFICYRWNISYTYSQLPKRKSSGTKPKVHSITHPVIGYSREMAESHMTSDLKKKRNTKLLSIESVIPTEVCFAFPLADPESEVPKEDFHLIPLPKATGVIDLRKEVN